MKTNHPSRSSRSGLLARYLQRTLLAFAALPALAQAQTPASELACHYTYGGETKVLKVKAVTSPYEVPAVQVGSYFMLRVVWQTSPAEYAAVNIYTYADGNDGPVIIHHAAFASPGLPSHPSRRSLPGDGHHGFTGMQRVYESMRDGELEYWCELTSPQGSKR